MKYIATKTVSYDLLRRAWNRMAVLSMDRRTSYTNPATLMYYEVQRMCPHPDYDILDYDMEI